MNNTAIIVPARLNSSRFPRKLLHPIAGKPLILWTAERLKKEAKNWPLYFAVADEELRSLLQAHHFKIIMTRSELPSGTDRLAEANKRIEAEYVINVQADEPLVCAEQIQALHDLIHQPGVDMATLATPFISYSDFKDPNQVKVVFSKNGKALYFSRAPIPHMRSDESKVSPPPPKNAYRHLGLYAYRSNFLSHYNELNPSTYEALERLEQLRALENGYAIAVGITHQPSIGIDTLEDALTWEAQIGV